jgi:hypothetical protein
MNLNIWNKRAGYTKQKKNSIRVHDYTQLFMIFNFVSILTVLMAILIAATREAKFQPKEAWGILNSIANILIIILYLYGINLWKNSSLLPYYLLLFSNLLVNRSQLFRNIAYWKVQSYLPFIGLKLSRIITYSMP